MGAHRLFHQVRPIHVIADIKRSDPGKFLRLGDPFMRQMHAFAIPLDFVILREALLLPLGDDELFLGLLASLAPTPFRPWFWPCPHPPRRP